MGGVRGWVRFDSEARTATVNVVGAGTCGSINVTLSSFPVMFGHFVQPCQERQVGPRVFTFSSSTTSNATVNVSPLFERDTILDDLSLTLETCNGAKACTVIRRGGQTILTRQARFYGSVAGNVYIRQNGVPNESQIRVLSDLATIGQVNATKTNVSAFAYQNRATSCDDLLGNLDVYALSTLGELSVGTPLEPVKSRLDLTFFGSDFLILKIGSAYRCAEFLTVEKKEVHVLVDMRGVIGYFSFRQASPFDVTEVRANLSGLQSRVGPYHVHQFPLPQTQSPPQSMCSNDNVGGHWNPFAVNTTDPDRKSVV